MSKKKTETTETGLDELNDSLTSITTKVQDNKKPITICSLIVVAIIAIILCYVYFFRGPGINKANDAIGAADLTLAQGNDSLALVQYQKVADESGYDAGNRAALQTAILLYQKGDYQKALDYVDQYSAKEEIIGAAAYSLKGDCYVNLDKLSEAIGCFKDAIKQSNDNPAYTPFFMMKLARVYAAQNNHSEEAALYKEIMTKYPTYGQAYNIDVEKLYDRANLEAGNK
jgi:TolA-binding protein